jgi:hypothetical protein
MMLGDLHLDSPRTDLRHCIPIVSNGGNIRKSQKKKTLAVPFRPSRTPETTELDDRKRSSSISSLLNSPCISMLRVVLPMDVLFFFAADRDGFGSL